jgi:hypothetical protein
MGTMRQSSNVRQRASCVEVICVRASCRERQEHLAVWDAASHQPARRRCGSLPWPTALAACSSATARGRTAAASSRIPRAMAPDVTITTSTRGVQGAASSQRRCTTSVPQVPESRRRSTTQLDDGDAHDQMERPIELEDDAADLDVVARREALGFRAEITPMLSQACLHEREASSCSRSYRATRRSTPSPLTPPLPWSVRLTSKVRGRRAKDAVLRHSGLPRMLRLLRARTRGALSQQLALELRHPAGGTRDEHDPGSAPVPTRLQAPLPVLGVIRSPWRGRGCG